MFPQPPANRREPRPRRNLRARTLWKNKKSEIWRRRPRGLKRRGLLLGFLQVPGVPTLSRYQACRGNEIPRGAALIAEFIAPFV